MLTPNQTDGIWRKMAEAEVRALYFAELATRYSLQQRWIASLSFFLSSGACITALGQATPLWVPALLGLSVAALQAYSIGFSLVDQATTAAKLHLGWDHLSDDYERLWNHWYEPDAERILERLQHRGRELSAEATKAPYKPDRTEHWARHVYSSYPDSETVTDTA